MDANLVPEVKERRLRARYAIVSTIAAAGYLPLRESLLSPIYGESSEDSRPVGYFETFWWAKPGKAEFHRVCVVWTPKKYMLTPEAVAAVRKYVEGADVATADGPVHIFHHGTSEDLTFYRNTHKADPQRDEMKYSFVRATISGSSDPRRPELQPLATDDILVDRLARDLTARIPALSSPGADPEKYPRIVIFTESDSRYSRAIVSELKQRLPKTRLDVYSYLRGLDGRSDESRPGKATETSGSTDADSSASKSSSLSETSFGTSQFDYIRRLASRLEGKKSRDKEMRVLAVGILGTDIYDKVLVLQAIRHELPSAIFFTTDLDALYLEPEVQSVTRNLLVASASDLDPPSPSPADDWQLPPMRDSYQTVLVKQVRQALAVHAGTATSDTPEKGSIFEIAPGKAVDLDPGNIDTAESLNPQEFLARLASPGFVIVLFGVAMVNGFLILLAVSSRRANRAASRPNENSAPMTAWAVCLIWLEAAVACAFGLYLLYQLGLGTHPLLWGEPLALGISIWPSVMIRVLAFLVALLLLVIASHSLVANERRWSDNLKTAVPSSTRVWCRAGWRLRAAWRRFHPFLDRLFDRRRRTLRIMIASTVYLLISLGLFYLWQPTVPARGPNALLIEKIVLSIGVALYMIHLVFCLELHFSALSLLRALRSCYLERHPASCSVDAKMMLNTVSDLTKVIGKTLLYPLTVLILIILSRLALFDNWVMTVSLTVTFAFGAFVLVAASAILWWEGFELKKDVMEQIGGRSRLTEKLQALDKGVFAAWYNQPIFSAILSGVAVFGSLTVAGPLLRLFLGL
ncbi:MAG TPA: hypothetical protein VGW57_04835 [Chthoniobacterales bacterium]|nr:hypothetical protein [Chthoniobacterales bacterium]